MKKVYYLVLLMLTVLATAQAQPDGSQPILDPPRIAGLKVAFVTRQLALTNEEAQKFWPVYYSYVAELKKTKNGQKEDVIALEENMLNVRKRYKGEFKKILLSDDRVNKVLTVERDFSNEVRKELLKRAKMRTSRGRILGPEKQ